MYDIQNIQVTEGTDGSPVSLQQTKDWITVDFDDDDQLIYSQLTGAARTVEGLLNLHLTGKNVTLDLTTGKAETVTLPFSKTVSNLVVKELDISDAETVLTANKDYFIRGNSLRLTSCGRFTVSYKTVPGDLPEDIKEAIKMEVAERYANRGENAQIRGNYDAPSSGISEAAKAKLQPYIVQWL